MKQTLSNLAKAFVGESQARNRYTIYASVAKKAGYLQIANVFLETAEQEKRGEKESKRTKACRMVLQNDARIRKN